MQLPLDADPRMSMNSQMPTSMATDVRKKRQRHSDLHIGHKLVAQWRVTTCWAHAVGHRRCFLRGCRHNEKQPGGGSHPAGALSRLAVSVRVG